MDNTYVSKDNGLTWTKRVGNSLTRSVYGGKFVDVGTSLSLITKRNQRTDGSSISPDVITIGQEGATTVIGGTTTNIGGRASISQGLTLQPLGDTSNHITFQRNGQFTMGIDAAANPVLILGDTTNKINIPGRLDVTTGPTTLSGGLSVTSGATTLSGGLTSNAGNTTLGATTATTLSATGLATLSGGVTMGNTTNMNSGANMNGTLQFTAPYQALGQSSSMRFTNTGFGTVEIHSIIGNAGAEAEHSRLRTVTAGREPLTINTTTGRVGIFNMLSPQADLDVNGSLRYVSSSVNSDRRIKKNIVDIDDMSALTILRKLKPKTYEYIDQEKRTDNVVFGFIAQEVKEELDYAVSQIKDPVPNIFSEATVTNDLITFTTYHTSNLLRDASNNWLKLVIKTKGIYEYVNIVEVLDEYTLRIDRDLLYLCENGTLFVYGQEVNDFHTLNKDAIWTVATAALQEVDRQLQAEKQKTATMQTALDALLERVNALEQKTSV